MNTTLRDGRYQLRDVLGTGGEARVHRAYDTVTQSEAAVRLALRPSTTPAPVHLPAFHPGWIKLHDAGVDPTLGAFQIYELCRGPTLHQLVRYGPLASVSWRLFVKQSLEAVLALHALQLTHGDLNGDNFIHAGPSQAGWRLLELPFLRFDAPPDRTALFGSIHTLAPEQLDGVPACAASDLYALGCLYYYAACGEYPYTGSTNQDIAIQRLQFDPVPLPEKKPRLAPAWSAWVMTLLERDPQKRHTAIASARQLLGVA